MAGVQPKLPVVPGMRTRELCPYAKRTAHSSSSSAGAFAVDWTSIATVQIYSSALGCCASAQFWMIPKVALGTTLGADFTLFEWSS